MRLPVKHAWLPTDPPLRSPAPWVKITAATPNVVIVRDDRHGEFVLQNRADRRIRRGEDAERP